VHTCADQHAAAYHTHCRTKVHWIRHWADCFLSPFWQQPSTLHVPSFEPTSPADPVSMPWRMGYQTSRSLGGSCFSFFQNCVHSAVVMGSWAPIPSTTLHHSSEMSQVAPRCQVSGHWPGVRPARSRGLAVPHSPVFRICKLRFEFI
jgi:hypothetical protein